MTTHGARDLFPEKIQKLPGFAQIGSLNVTNPAEISIFLWNLALGRYQQIIGVQESRVFSFIDRFSLYLLVLLGLISVPLIGMVPRSLAAGLPYTRGEYDTQLVLYCVTVFQIVVFQFSVRFYLNRFQSWVLGIFTVEAVLAYIALFFVGCGNAVPIIWETVFHFILALGLVIWASFFTTYDMPPRWWLRFRLRSIIRSMEPGIEALTDDWDVLSQALERVEKQIAIYSS